MNNIDVCDYDVERTAPVEYASLEAIQKFIDDCENKRTQSEKEARNKERERIRKIDEGVGFRILKFIEIKPHLMEEINVIYQENKTGSWRSIAEKIADYFNKMQEIANADYFYELAIEAAFACNSWEDSIGPSLSQGYMHLDAFNREIVATTPKRPTAIMCCHLEKAISGLNTPSPFEAAEFVCHDLLKIRNMFVRWNLHLKTLKTDQWAQANHLIQKIYAYNFIQIILKQVKAFKNFKYVDCYDGSKNNNDLAKHLIKLGFCGIYQGYNQHDWVHPNGFMVRVKRIKNEKAEYTIGITLENPINWNSDGTPRSLKKYNSNQEVILDYDNEILKLAYDGQAVFVIPGSREKCWVPYWFDSKQIGSMMKCAHFPLNNFGIKNKNGYYDTTRLENHLSLCIDSQKGHIAHRLRRLT